MNAAPSPDTAPLPAWAWEAARLLLRAYPAPDLTPGEVLTLPGFAEHLRDAARNPARLGFLPDALTDSTRQRARRARALEAEAGKLRDALARLDGSGEMVMVTATLHGLELPALYGKPGKAAAAALFAHHFPGVPALWVREWGERRGPHVHGILPAQLAPVARAAGFHVCRVHSLKELARYLSKPIDARAARLDYARAPELPALLAALSDLTAARALSRASGAFRLPRKWDTANTRRPSATRNARAARRKATRRTARRRAVSAATRARSDARALVMARAARLRPSAALSSSARYALAPALTLPPIPPGHTAGRGNGPAP